MKEVGRRNLDGIGVLAGALALVNFGEKDAAGSRVDLEAADVILLLIRLDWVAATVGLHGLQLDVTLFLRQRGILIERGHEPVIAVDEHAEQRDLDELDQPMASREVALVHAVLVFLVTTPVVEILVVDRVELRVASVGLTLQ